MRIHALIYTALLVAMPVFAESARTIRATELQAQSQSDAATLATLPKDTRVDVLRRSGAWSEVKTMAGQSGWVRMLNLRSEVGAGSKNADAAGNAGNPLGALSNLLSTGRTSGTATVTTGVRGLTEEDLQNAQADPGELQKAQKFAAKKNAAQAFAQRTKLLPVQLEYLTEPAPVHQASPVFDGG